MTVVKLTDFLKRRKCMCLDSITQKLDPLPLIESGWKNFSGSSGRPKFMSQLFHGGSEVELDKWLKAEGTAIAGPGRNSYDAGFHIYSAETELGPRNSFRRVYFRNAHTRGMQDVKTVTVAKEMYVPSDQEAWPPKG